MKAKGVIVGLLALLVGLPAIAQAAGPLSMGSGETTSSTYSVVLALAKSASAEAGLDLRPRPFKGSTQAIPFVNQGEIDFGLESALGLTEAFGGTGTFEGQPMANLRLVGTIYPFRVGFIVREADPALTIADLRGKPVATANRSAPNITSLTLALLATGGLTKDDVEGVDATTSGEARDLFIAGNLTALVGGIDAASTTQLVQSVGPLRFLILPEGDAAEQAARAFVPAARVIVVDPERGRVGVDAPTPVLEYDYFVYASVTTPDEAVLGIIDTLAKRKDELVEMVPSFAWFDPAKMAPQIGVPYHPAAEAHYKELGFWPAQ